MYFANLAGGRSGVMLYLLKMPAIDPRLDEKPFIALDHQGDFEHAYHPCRELTRAWKE